MVDRSAPRVPSTPPSALPASAQAPDATALAALSTARAQAPPAQAVVLATRLEGQLAQTQALRETLQQLDASLTQALLADAREPTPTHHAQVEALVQQARQWRQELVARGVSLPSLDLPPSDPSQPPGAPSRQATAAPVPQAASPTPEGPGRAVLVPPPADPRPGLPRQGLAVSVAGSAPTPAWPQQPSTAPAIASSWDVATPAVAASAVPGPALPAPPELGPAIESTRSPPQPQPQPPMKSMQPMQVPQPMQFIPSSQPTPPMRPEVSVAPNAVQVDAASRVLPGPVSLADRSAFSELERQRAVAASRGSLDEASLRHAPARRQGRGSQREPLDPHTLSAREWAQLEHLWDVCRLALAQWHRHADARTQAAVVRAFEDLDRFGQWMAGQGKSVPRAPDDVRNPFDVPGRPA